MLRVWGSSSKREGERLGRVWTRRVGGGHLNDLVDIDVVLEKRNQDIRARVSSLVTWRGQEEGFI